MQALAGQRVEAVVVAWNRVGPAGPAAGPPAGDDEAIRERVEAACSSGIDVYLVSGSPVDSVDGQLKARPTGPGHLTLCVDRGSEVFRVGPHGAQLVHRRTATAPEEGMLDAAVARVVERLTGAGVRTEVVGHRGHRRTLDLVPEPQWADAPDSRVGELVAAVTARLSAGGIAGLGELVDLALEAGRGCGLPDPRVTCDGKHLEIGCTDPSDSMRWILDDLAGRGVGPGLVLVAVEALGPPGAVPRCDADLLVGASSRAVVVTTGTAQSGADHVLDARHALLALLDEQLELRRTRRVPDVDRDPQWTVTIPGDSPLLRRAHETVLTLADGRLGTRGSLEEDGVGTTPLTVAAGVYSGTRAATRLLPAPNWVHADLRIDPPYSGRRTLDLRTGVLLREAGEGSDTLRTLRFLAVHRPGTALLRIEGPAARVVVDVPLVLPRDPDGEQQTVDDVRIAVTRGDGAVCAAARQDVTRTGGRVAIERSAAYVATPERTADSAAAREALAAAHGEGFDRLLRDHRAAWVQRWADAQVDLVGDADLELCARFALFHVLGNAPDEGEAVIGARGLSGTAYSGHVFWDTDVFVLPVLAAVRPQAARTVLEYRLRRLPAARAIAAGHGLPGARFPWESAADGFDVTPPVVLDPGGHPVRIFTGEHEEHIVADVAWAAWHYVEWTGDEEFLAGAGAPLLTDTARYWAARCRTDRDGRAHLYGVVGPDEYHEVVDDNAYTNVMARWNLRRGADVIERYGVGGTRAEAARWRAIADDLVDGYEPATGRYEQFAGFFRLDPLLIGDVAEPPVAADLLLGRDRVMSSQVVKQPDVLMLHHLVREEVKPGSLGPNLDFYAPRTAHGSSLSPAISASLLLRAGREAEGLDLLRVAGRLDLDDVTETTAGGLHIACLGGVWQAFAFGVAGLWPRDGVLTIDPRLPAAWDELTVRVRFRGARVTVRVRANEFGVTSDAPVRLRPTGAPLVEAGPGEVRFVRAGSGWRQDGGQEEGEPR
ncbi:MAG TPA: glycosyl hydrolase family 65 protein [Mycobacteriales bacterium]|nr:glycosyl hydrolase family 65 protein [Mycobacteriales bacterium]